ncbi:UNKNOWN [Stylonychia lemnae]|uniref:Uncharacterized protein n=1 Tax=Stylonychia lemnae TaxID=5949 RepID=A0A078A0E8_STYLE|nr:UNKNOWN [Stylonychia lemnae]|eukprot:CDW74923.1 UNKNOWN [Stylonychia lemnae]
MNQQEGSNSKIAIPRALQFLASVNWVEVFFDLTNRFPQNTVRTQATGLDPVVPYKNVKLPLES